MAIQDHIHIQALTGAAESGIYHVRHGTLDDTPLVPLTVDRALDTTLHFNRSLDSDGDPIVLTNKNFTVSFASRAEIDALIALAARPCYFIGIDHSADGNTSGHTTDRKTVLLGIKPNSLTNIDTGCQYWTIGLELVDDD